MILEGRILVDLHWSCGWWRTAPKNCHVFAAILDGGAAMSFTFMSLISEVLCLFFPL
jgi:hypothetical protein